LTRITEGEPDFALAQRTSSSTPNYAPSGPGSDTTCSTGSAADHKPYYGALKPLLEGHAEYLAMAIDHTCSG
jgi:hypothetical protein